jgi:hypothetical protein
MSIEDFQEQFPNRPNISSEITKNVINQTTLPGFQEIQGSGIDPYSQQLIQNVNDQYGVAPIGPQGAGLYPGTNHNINVGGVSGSQIGSGNIYVPGGNIRAVDPVLARRKAIDDAAKARAASIKPFDYADPMKLTDARFQKKYNDSYHNAMESQIDKMKERHGKDWTIIAGDKNTPEGRKLVQTGANYEYLGRNVNQITDKISDIEAHIAVGDRSYSPKALKAVDNLRNLVGDFENADAFAMQDLQTQYEDFEGVIAIEEYVAQPGFLKGIMGETSGSVYTNDSGEYYSTKTNEKLTWKEALPEVAKSLASGPLAEGVRRGIYTEEEMLDVLETKFKDQQTQTGSITKKNKENVGGESYAEEGTNFTNDQPATVNFLNYNDDGTISDTQTEYNSFYEYEFNTAASGNKLLKIDDLKVTNNGEEQTLQGSNEVQFTGLSTLQYKDSKGNLRTKVVTRAKINSTVKQAYDKDGNKIRIENYKPDLGHYTDEQRVVIDKPVDLTDHVYAQMRKGMSEADKAKLKKGRDGAFKRKKELEGGTTEVVKGDAFN